MRVLYAAILLVFLVAVLVFCIQNLETVSISYLGWRASVPLPLLVVSVYLFGMISGWGIWAILRRSLRGATASKE